jgi:hypothetical protein
VDFQTNEDRYPNGVCTEGLAHQGTYLMSCFLSDTVSRFDEVKIASFKHFWCLNNH